MSQVAAEPRKLTIALIGNPNTGKSTLFNALSGMNARIGNFPGVTVEKKIGRIRKPGRRADIVDLPGTYSLAPRTLDEMVSVDVLLGRQRDVDKLDAVVCIVDATNLERNLYLVSQVLDLKLPTVLVVNMWDAARQAGVEIDVEELQSRLGIPVVTTSAQRREGIDKVWPAVDAAIAKQATGLADPFPGEFRTERDRLADTLRDLTGEEVPRFLAARMLLDADDATRQFVLGTGTPAAATGATAVAEARARLKEAGCAVPAIEPRVRYAWARQTLQGVLTRRAKGHETTISDKIDRILTHRVSGLIVFVAVMFVIFQAIFTWAGPFMEWTEAGQGFVTAAVESAMAPGAFRSLLVDGVIAGVGSVLVFLPQIVMLFFFIALLEDCGYMARAAFLMDRLMTRVGLSGKSFVPLMSSFACAVPGIMATRVIENRRDRMVTILVAPLMSCSARLPVYLLLIAAFVPAVSYAGGWLSLQGLVLAAMYSLGALVAIPVAWVLKKTFFRGELSPFVMELPPYKWPSPRVVLDRVYDRGKAFVLRAGSLIFLTTIIVWAAGYFPADHTELNAVTAELERLDSDADEEHVAALEQQRKELAARNIEQSFLGRFGHAVEPVVMPLGWDWRIGVGVIASFPAREVIIATLGTIYSLGGDVDETDEGLIGKMRSATWADGDPIFTLPVVFSVMVFFALCAQCAATLMVIRRETNSWFWPVFAFTYMTLLAYLGALVTYQAGTALMS